MRLTGCMRYAVVSLQLIHRILKVMRRLSSCITVFVPLGLVAGIMGMNVLVPFQNTLYHSHWPFIAIILGMVLSGCCMFAIFKKAKWL